MLLPCRESFALRDLADCSVFLLDFTSEVECTNCTNCQIFIGPVDGPAIFDAIHNCQVAVACQQFQAKGCTDCQFGLYCATGPTISGSKNMHFSCWAGAYPGLASQFASANLDPKKNQWNKVYDATAPAEGEDSPPNFDISTAPSPFLWEVPVEDATGPPENPVPGPDGAAYQPHEPAPGPAPTAPAAAPLDDAFFGGDDAGDDGPGEASAALPLENGNGAHPASGAAAAGYDVEPPSTAAARESMQARMAAQAKEETEKKAVVTAAAAKYLQEFYDGRNRAKGERIAQGREVGGSAAGETGPQGSGTWERVLSMVDFNAARPSGTDLSRFKSVLLACKEREAGSA